MHACNAFSPFFFDDDGLSTFRPEQTQIEIAATPTGDNECGVGKFRFFIKLNQQMCFSFPFSFLKRAHTHNLLSVFVVGNCQAVNANQHTMTTLCSVSVDDDGAVDDGTKQVEQVGSKKWQRYSVPKKAFLFLQFKGGMTVDTPIAQNNLTTIQ